MPIDTRSLIFDQEELSQALVMFCRAKGRAAPEAGFFHLRPVLNRHSKIVVSADTGSNVTIFAEHEVAAAMILYCLRSGIPLPHSAEKSLVLEADGSLSLNLTVTAGLSAAPYIAPLV